MPFLTQEKVVLIIVLWGKIAHRFELRCTYINAYNMMIII